MNKGLEALRRYKRVTCQQCQYHYGGVCNNKGECFSMIIEKELEALSTIVQIFDIKVEKNKLGQCFVLGTNNLFPISQETYDLLKEVGIKLWQ